MSEVGSGGSGGPASGGGDSGGSRGTHPSHSEKPVRAPYFPADDEAGLTGGSSVRARSSASRTRSARNSGGASPLVSASGSRSLA
jgi:hypothetical protein